MKMFLKRHTCMSGGITKMFFKNRKGIFFSTDALIALMLIFMSALIIYPLINQTKIETEIQGDVISVLSSIKIGEINNSYVKTLIENGTIKDLNKSILEQIGEFYVTDVNTAKKLAQLMISTIDSNENIGIWYGTTLLASQNSTQFDEATTISIERQTISGIQEGESVTGFSARAYFTSDIQTKYFYFGGYVGEGNLTARMYYTGNISSVVMEIAINKNFKVYVNNNLAGSYVVATPSSPENYTIPINDFVSGTNIIEIRGDNLNIAGGYIRLDYQTDVQYSQTKKYNFPGINGFVNLYDSFYIPEQLNAMNIYLHLNSSQPLFLKIGNITIYNNYTNDEETINFTNSELSSLLNYNNLIQKTIPLRLGLENTSYIFNITKDADVFSVTDLSGSMDPTCSGASWWCCWMNNCDVENTCVNTCGGTYEDKLSAAKTANNLFIDSVLNETGNQVGLVGYRDQAYTSDYHALSTDNVSLKAEVNSWAASGNTCICCGINKATTELVADSNPQNFRSMVVMSDGAANRQCAEQGTGSSSQDAINAACEAYDNYGIIVYSVGFGSGVEESTLQSIADCGHGEYFFSDVSELGAIYQQIAQDIIDASYSEQTVEITGNFNSQLYSDSYIEFNHDPVNIPHGLITVNEKSFDGPNSATFNLPENSSILETRVISYSGSKWTNEVKINSDSIFNLTNYGNDYLELGDPYSINVPNSFVTNFNTINLTTGLSPYNSTGGSIGNKIIYYISKEYTAYSSISSQKEGCIWNIEFEDASNITTKIPSDYLGSEYCYYQEGNIVYNSNDAISEATYGLLENLDFDLNGKIDVKFSEQNFEIDTSQITGIPYDWSTEVQVRKWS